jgi:hypothetical protein
MRITHAFKLMCSRAVQASGGFKRLLLQGFVLPSSFGLLNLVSNVFQHVKMAHCFEAWLQCTAHAEQGIRVCYCLVSCSCCRDLSAAAAPLAAALQHPTTHSTATEPGNKDTAAAAAAAATTADAGLSEARRDAAPSAAPRSSSQCELQGMTAWGQLLMHLPNLTCLTTLEFSKNASAWAPLAPHPSATVQEPAVQETAAQQAAVQQAAVQQAAVQQQQGPPMLPHNVEAAMLLLAFAAAQQTVLTTLILHAPKGTIASVGSYTGRNTVRPVEQQVGALTGQWGAALVEVVTEMLLAIGSCQVGPEGLQQQQEEEQEEVEQQQQQAQASEGSAPATRNISSSSSSRCCMVQPAAAEQLHALVLRVHAQQQQQQQQQQQDQQVVQRDEQAPVDGHVPGPCLSRVEAAEVLRLLLPGLHRLDLNW